MHVQRCSCVKRRRLHNSQVKHVGVSAENVSEKSENVQSGFGQDSVPVLEERTSASSKASGIFQTGTEAWPKGAAGARRSMLRAAEVQLAPGGRGAGPE